MIKRSNILSRTLHKWLALIIGIQLLIWLASGLYFVIVDIDFIHGDPLVKNTRQAISIPDLSVVGVTDLLAQYPDASNIELRSVMGETRYVVTTPDRRYLVDPVKAVVLSPLDEQAAREIAAYHFTGDALIAHATLITSDPPMEIQTRRLPLWRVDFEDRFSTSFYIDPLSGRLVTRRHQYWRMFDFLWMLHIMDYDQRADAHNPLLIIAQIAGLAFGISGLWLLFYSFSGRRRKKVVTE